MAGLLSAESIASYTSFSVRFIYRTSLTNEFYQIDAHTHTNEQ